MKRSSRVLICVATLAAILPAVARAGELERDEARMLRLQPVCEQGLVNLDKTPTAASDAEWRDAVHAWHERHAAVLAELRDLQQKLAKQTGLADTPRTEEPPVSADAPAAARPALEEARRLREEVAQIQYDYRGASALERRDAVHGWMAKNAARFAENADRLQAVLPAVVRPAIIVLTPELPPGLDSEIGRRLLANAALDAELADLMNQLRNASPIERRDAMHDWHENHAQRLRDALP